MNDHGLRKLTYSLANVLGKRAKPMMMLYCQNMRTLITLTSAFTFSEHTVHLPKETFFMKHISGKFITPVSRLHKMSMK